MNNIKRWYIYGLLRGTKVIYVGKTVSIYRRMKEHRCNFGDWPVFKILATGIRSSWQKAERKWIAELKPPLNLSSGGFGGRPLAPSTRTKLSISGRAKKPGTSSALKKLWQDPEYRSMMIEVHRKPNSGQFKKGYNSPRKGGHREDLSVKARQSISAKVSRSLVGNRRAAGKPWTEDQKAKLRGRVPWNKGLLNWQDAVCARRRT